VGGVKRERAHRGGDRSARHYSCRSQHTSLRSRASSRSLGTRRTRSVASNSNLPKKLQRSLHSRCGTGRSKTSGTLLRNRFQASLKRFTGWNALPPGRSGINASVHANWVSMRAYLSISRLSGSGSDGSISPLEPRDVEPPFLDVTGDWQQNLRVFTARWARNLVQG